MLRDNLVGLIEPMPTARESGSSFVQDIGKQRDRHRTIDPHALKIPPRRGGIFTNGKNFFSISD